MENILARFDSALKTLDEVAVKDQMVDYMWELRSVKLFYVLIMEMECACEDPFRGSIRTDIKDLLEEVERKRRVEEWEDLGSDVIPKLDRLKTKVREITVDYSLNVVFGYSLQMGEYIDLTLWSLWGFCNNKGGVISTAMKKKVSDFYCSLSCMGKVYVFSLQRCWDREKLEEFWRFVEGVVNEAACLSVLCWTDSEDGENLGVRLDSMLKKIKPCENPMVMETYFGVLLSLKSSQCNKFFLRDTVVNLCDLLLIDVVTPDKNLWEGLIFLTTFLHMNPPPERHDGDDLLARIRDIIICVASSICAISIPHESGEVLVGLQAEVGKVMAEIRETCVPKINFSGSSFPLTNGIGFIDRLLGNLKETLQSRPNSALFVRHRILSIEEDLKSMRSFFKDVMALKMEKQEVRDLWNRLVNASYFAEHAIDSCFDVHAAIWYDMQRLFEITEEIKVIKMEVQKLTIDMEKPVVDEFHSHPPLPRQADTSRMEGVIGFTDEVEIIIDRLKRGTTQLDIVSIVGMPGQGKTTLAKMVYHHPSVKYHFNRLAWCCVSQVYQKKELLFDILSAVTADPDIRTTSNDASENDLAEMLYKSLKGRRFLIVMDDIWDVGAFDGIEISFPDDGTGSRILFTTRIHNLVLQFKPNSDPHPIRTLKDEESWELLQSRLDGYPLELSEVGKEIATKCKGLPLAIVLVAGILTGMDKNHDSWKEMLENMGTATNGCKDLVELSYNHLPDFLKPCFLYFGSFPEDGIIRAKKLMQLWSAEGFVPKNDVNSLVAREYLMNLIDRSLVIVESRNSLEEVGTCCVHDVIHDFCLEKAQEERFLHKVVHTSAFSNSYEQYRLCIASKPEIFMDSGPAGSYVRSLSFIQGRGAGYPYDSSTYGAFFLGFKFLHVLNMECICLSFFPVEITSMMYLRYLACHSSWEYLPSSIGNLQDLETLLANGVKNVPDAIWSIKTLRCIKVTAMVFKGYSKHSSYQLENVVSLSRAMLTLGEDMEVLSTRFPRLRKLQCELDNQLGPEDPIQFPDFSWFSQLESLHVIVNYKLLSNCNLHQCLSSFDLPRTLKKLKLRFFKVTKSAISTIGKLPNLQVLRLAKSSFVDQSWDLEDGEFLNLKLLDLNKVNLVHWKDCEVPFPCLENLYLQSCDVLEEMPPSFGCIGTLKIMALFYCEKALSSAKGILEAQRSVGNDDLKLYFDRDDVAELYIPDE